MNRQFNLERRREILDECFLHLKTIEDLELEYEEAEPPEADALELVLDHAQERLDELVEEYRKGIPFVELSRCPFCGTVIKHSIDTFGLDGLWWDNENPVRPEESGLCPHFLALDGAVQVALPVQPAPILVCPGPDVPCLVSRLVEKEAVRAVISAVPIGKHTGYAIFYFARTRLNDVELVNTWGTNFYSCTGADGEEGWDEHVEAEADVDFDLRRWADAGRLLWIAPGDASLELKTGAAGCPYLDMEGSRQLLRVQNGELWTAPLAPSFE